jgi:hypothetical protein
MASETATAQQLKGNFGNMRLVPRQVPFERFIRETFRIMAEVVAEKFSRQTLEQMSGKKLGMTGNPDIDQTGEQVLALLRDDKLRSYKIDIETDTMIQPDEQAEKQATIEFVSAITNFLKAAVEIAGVNPQMAPLLMQMLKQASRRFKLGREIEEEIEKTVESLEEAAKNPAPPPPNPEVEKERIKAEGAAKQTEIQTQADLAKAEHDARLRDEEGKRDHERKMLEIERKAELERERALADDLARRQEAERADKDAEHKRGIEAEKQRHEHTMKDREASLREADDARKRDDHAAKMEDRQATREMNKAKLEGAHAERDAKVTEAGSTKARAQSETTLLKTIEGIANLVESMNGPAEMEAVKDPKTGTWKFKRAGKGKPERVN